MPQDQVTDLLADLAAKADAEATTAAVATKAATADLASTEGAGRIGRDTGGTLAQALQGVLNAAGFGMAPANTASENSTALKAAIAAASAGYRIIIPQSAYTMSVTGGLSDAVIIDKPLTLQINDTLTANGFAIQTNPYYMFRVAADNVVLTGSGTIAGNGTIDDANAGTATTHPGLIYVLGDYFTFAPSLTVLNVPKVGIALISCEGANIGGTWIGGPPVYGSTGYFGVLCSSGGDHVFENFKALRDGSGGRHVNYIYGIGPGGASTNITVRNSYAEVWEKIFDGVGAGCTFHDCKGVGDMTNWICLSRDNNRAYTTNAAKP